MKIKQWRASSGHAWAGGRLRIECALSSYNVFTHAMTSPDSHVTRFIFEDLDICGAIVHLGTAWQAMQQGRNYPPVVRNLLGEMAAVAAVIGSNLKTPGRLTFQVQGDGPVSLLVVDCEETAAARAQPQLLLRGMARCDEGGEVLEVAPLQALLGDGKLLFSLQSRMSDMPYQSYVGLEGERIADVFEQFMTQSAQQPARLWLFADEEQAACLFLQTLPAREHPERADADGWNRVQQLAATVRADELRLSAEVLLRRLFAEDTLRLFESRPVQYYCPRDEDKVRGMLISLGRDEIAALIAEHGEIVIQDDICNHEYRFGPGIVDELFPSAGQVLH